MALCVHNVIAKNRHIICPEKGDIYLCCGPQNENSPFMFDGVNYREELEKFSVQIERSMASRRGRGGKSTPKGPFPSSSKV